MINVKIVRSNNMLRRLTVCCLCCVALFAHAENRGLAWELNSKDGLHKAYLMGAVHLANGSFYPINSAVLDGFDASDVLMVELDDSRVEPQAQQALIEQYAYYPEGVSYKDRLSPALVDQVEIMFASLGIENASELFSRYKPGLLGVTLAALQAQVLGYSAEYGIDSYFLEKARYRKKIEELESFEFQIKLISELPSDEESFSDALLNMADFESEWKGLEDAWKQGDADLMYELAIGEGMRDFPSLENYYEVLFFKRNVQMAEKLEQCFSDRVCFMVVGAGHLVGPSGVVDLLQKKG
ncbi:hypothetical protein A3750_22795, partial [Oleiphilus sp. HI0079]